MPSPNRQSQAFTHHPEDRCLNTLAPRVAPHLTANQLSLMAFIGALLTALAYLSAGPNLNLLHLANLGILIHWFGDSLDGRVARLRGESRPVYGHYLDHLLDALTTAIVLLAIAASPLTTTPAWLWTLILAQLLLLHTSIKTSATRVFELSIGRFGPTEARISLVIINLLVLLTGNPSIPFLLGYPATLLDAIGLLAALLIALTLAHAVATSLWGRHRVPDR